MFIIDQQHHIGLEVRQMLLRTVAILSDLGGRPHITKFIEYTVARLFCNLEPHTVCGALLILRLFQHSVGDSVRWEPSFIRCGY